MSHAWLVLWGTVVSLDLVSVPQVMIARPIVAGTVAGWLVGDLSAGVLIGVLFELYASEVLPVGAARYPDYGVGSVAAVATAAGAPSLLGAGAAVIVGLVVALIGEWSIQWVRRRNSYDLRRHVDEVDGGNVSVTIGLHLRSLGRDASRGALVVAIGLGLAWATRAWFAVSVRDAVLLIAVAAGVALGTMLVSGLRLVQGARGQFAWLAVGLLAGTAWVIWR